MINPRIKTIALAGKKVGYRELPFIVAEAGVNHNGSLATALKLVDAAAQAGADAVKFQTFKAEQVVSKSAQLAVYQKNNIGKSESQLSMLKRLELKESFYEPIIERCKKKNILFLSTPHGSFAAVDFLQKLKVAAFKFGSGDINNFPVLKYAARFGKPIILGTGMSTRREVIDAIQCIKKAGNNKIIVLHCTTNYPVPDSWVNLAALRPMIEKLDVLVGYSDHSQGTQVPVMAVTLGACLVEKHFTLDKTMAGPDHKASIETDELRAMIIAVKRVKIILGSSLKRPNQSELIMLKQVRKSIVATRTIKKGERFTKENIGIKRPGTGLPPGEYLFLLNKKAKRAIISDALIKRSDYV